MTIIQNWVSLCSRIDPKHPSYESNRETNRGSLEWEIPGEKRSEMLFTMSLSSYTLMFRICEM